MSLYPHLLCHVERAEVIIMGAQTFTLQSKYYGCGGFFPLMHAGVGGGGGGWQCGIRTHTWSHTSLTTQEEKVPSFVSLSPKLP